MVPVVLKSMEDARRITLKPNVSTLVNEITDRGDNTVIKQCRAQQISDEPKSSVVNLL